MKNYLIRNKYTWIVLAPLVAGWLFNFLMFVLPFTGFLLWTFNIGFVLFWFWAGRQFAGMSSNKVYGFIFGNLLWLMSLLLFIWQFFFVDEGSRNLMLAGLSQYYILYLLMFATQIHLMYSEVISSNEVIIISYVLMFIVFTAGFIYQLVKNKK